jgi:predicted nucleotide-binding protein
MARKRNQEPPRLMEKEFTLAEIQRGIAKLRRRIEEVQALDPNQITHDDERVNIAQRNIRDTVREIFGENSQAALDFAYPEIYASTGRRPGYGEVIDYQGNFARGITQMVTSLNGLIARLEEKALDIPVEPSSPPTSTNTVIAHEDRPSDPTKVFVVHGRNEAARNAMFQFLRSLGLKPIEWPQAVLATGKVAPYIGEVLDVAFSTAQAVVVLMTPDDMAYLRPSLQGEREPPFETEPTPQARPNVLFEAGMAMGRHPDRTILVELSDLRPFSDVGGRHVVRINNTSSRRHDLADRLAVAHCPVDLSGRDWHTAGDFDAALEGL